MEDEETKENDSTFLNTVPSLIHARKEMTGSYLVEFFAKNIFQKKGTENMSLVLAMKSVVSRLVQAEGCTVCG